ncbi:protein kinase domain-containing protein 30 [Elsinoe australis]|uniref:Protein kinase domain-containing protein 30 n=1 Tax=Elsinoe australis TaxID=40998 RepID=A0A4U7AUN4_9PEZI|nr:protein kinase domain-containing protein 30 [Elsinoe australis]
MLKSRDLEYENLLSFSITLTDILDACPDAVLLPRFDSARLNIDWYCNNTECTRRPVAVRDASSPTTMMAFKPSRSATYFLQEVNTLLKLKTHPHRSALRIPDLLGLIEDQATQKIEGFLMTHVKHSSIMELARQNVSLEKRNVWMDQIEAPVKGLHEMGLVWGDVKPENVLVDEAGNAWVIDVEGGYLPEWVDQDLQGTQEGDLRAVMKMREMLI